MIMMALGFASSPRSTFVKPITEQLGLERGLYSVSDSFRYAATSIMNFFFGALIVRFGARKLVGFGFFSLILYNLISAVATSYWHFYVSAVFLGIGLSWTTTTIVAHIVETWFTNDKGTIMGVILAANGLGGVFSENIITRIVFGADGSIPYADAKWRLAFIVVTLVLVVVGIFVCSFLRNKPSELHLEPLGKDKPSIKKKRGADWEGYSMAQILKKPYFYVSAVCVFLTGFVLQSLHSAAKPHMQDVGLSNEFIITAFSAFYIILMASKIAAGYAFDRFGIRPVFLICCVSGLIALLSSIFVTPEHSFFAYFYVLFCPLALPLETIMIPLLVAEMYGKKAYTKIMGYFLGLNVAGYAFGSPMAHMVFDMTGSYHVAFYILSAILLMVTILTQITFLIAKRDRAEFERNAISA